MLAWRDLDLGPIFFERGGPYYLGAIDSPRLTRGELTHRDWDYPYGTGVTTSTGCHDDALLTMHLFEDHTPVIAHKHCQELLLLEGRSLLQALVIANQSRHKVIPVRAHKQQ